MHSIERLPAFSRSEVSILHLIALGFSAKEIAQCRSVSPRTIETQIDTMRLKLRARNRTHLVAIAIASKILADVEDISEIASLRRSRGVGGLAAEGLVSAEIDHHELAAPISAGQGAAHWFVGAG